MKIIRLTEDEPTKYFQLMTPMKVCASFQSSVVEVYFDEPGYFCARTIFLEDEVVVVVDRL